VLATAVTYDAAVIDRMRRGSTAWRWSRPLRGTGVQKPIIFLTARGAIEDRVEGRESQLASCTERENLASNAKGKAQVAPTARPKVPMRWRGADCSVVVMKRGNASALGNVSTTPGNANEWSHRKGSWRQGSISRMRPPLVGVSSTKGSVRARSAQAVLDCSRAQRCDGRHLVGRLEVAAHRISGLRAGKRRPDRVPSFGGTTEGPGDEAAMTRREKTTLVLELAFATALAFVVAAILYGKVGLPLLFVLPAGELSWAAVILCFMS
jgi:hypothetical protein